eukprot:1810028-Pyramimonas_sp.AAC.1
MLPLPAASELANRDAALYRNQPIRMVPAPPADMIVDGAEEVPAAVVQKAPPQRVRREDDRQQRRVHQEPDQE